ncbi:MAG: hypothetical protein HOI95_29965 [Chromatiales bacterium]|nr:hypothetical protein [Chromatiales bacterium]
MAIAQLAELRRRKEHLQGANPTSEETQQEQSQLIDTLLARCESTGRAIDAIPLALSVRDLKGRYTIANSAMPVNSGLHGKADDFLGKGFSQLQPAGAESQHVAPSTVFARQENLCSRTNINRR